MKPLAYLILDASGRMVDSGGPADQSRLQARVDRWNHGPIDPRFPYRLEARPYRLAPVAEVPAWQPIETAPREGTRFLAFSPFGSQKMDIVSWNDEADSWADFSGAWWPGGDLSHWQPLPAPPKEDA